MKFRTGSLPASTGISARNPAGSALVAGAWALQPLEAFARAAEIASPLQCPAPNYGSSSAGPWRFLRRTVGGF